MIGSLGSLRGLLADADVEVRRTLPYLLAVCDDQEARPLLRERLEREHDAAARASVVLALAGLGERDIPDGRSP